MLGSRVVLLPLITVTAVILGPAALVGSAGAGPFLDCDRVPESTGSGLGRAAPPRWRDDRGRRLRLPSGHAAHSIFYVWLSVTIAVRLAPTWPQGCPDHRGHSAGALVGLSLVYLGVHHLSDVFRRLGSRGTLLLVFSRSGPCFWASCAKIRPMVLAVSTQIWYFGAAGLVSLAAFVGLIPVPAVSSYGRWHERFAAGFLSLLIFGADHDRRHRGTGLGTDLERHRAAQPVHGRVSPAPKAKSFGARRAWPVRSLRVVDCQAWPGPRPTCWGNAGGLSRPFRDRMLAVAGATGRRKQS